MRASALKSRRAQIRLAYGRVSFGSAFKANIARTSLATQAGSFNLSRGGCAGGRPSKGAHRGATVSPTNWFASNDHEAGRLLVRLGPRSGASFAPQPSSKPCLGSSPVASGRQRHDPMKVLRGKKALVTGAASGIGRAIALALAREGVDLYLVDIDDLKIDPVAREARAHGVEVRTVHCDLARPKRSPLWWKTCFADGVD